MSDATGGVVAGIEAEQAWNAWLQRRPIAPNQREVFMAGRQSVLKDRDDWIARHSTIDELRIKAENENVILREKVAGFKQMSETCLEIRTERDILRNDVEKYKARVRGLLLQLETCRANLEQAGQRLSRVRALSDEWLEQSHRQVEEGGSSAPLLDVAHKLRQALNDQDCICPPPVEGNQR